MGTNQSNIDRSKIGPLIWIWLDLTTIIAMCTNVNHYIVVIFTAVLS